MLPTEQQTTGIEGKINELETKLGDLAESVKDVCNLPPLQHEFKAGGHRPRGLVWAALKDKNSHFGGSNPKNRMLASFEAGECWESKQSLAPARCV